MEETHEAKPLHNHKTELEEKTVHGLMYEFARRGLILEHESAQNIWDTYLKPKWLARQ